MGQYSRKSLWIVLLFLSAAGTARGQWRVAASNIVPGVYAGTAGGCIAFKNGAIWAGAVNLVGSTDTGKTWYGINTPSRDEIVDISVLNKDTAAIATWGNLYVTRNGGVTWSSAINNGCHRILFSIDGKSIFACGPTAFYVSTDFGGFWGTAYSSPEPMNTFVQGIDSTIYITESQIGSGPINSAFLLISSDNGQSWVSNPGLVDEDSWTIDVDSCDPSRVYVANENFAERNDGFSKIYVSSNRGQTWSAPFSQIAPYLVGSIANSGNALYIETLSAGMFRSEDEGNTWQNIGGPICYADCRGIATVNDNIVLALDTGGSIWITTNSGGSPIQSFFSAGPAVVFSGDTVACDSIAGTVQFHRKSCARTWVDAWSIIGMDALSYRGNNLSPDSMEVSLNTLQQGAQSGLLILHINDGSTDTIQLAGFVHSLPDKLQPSVSTLFDLDTAGCDSVMRSIYFTDAGCHPAAVTVVSCNIIGPDSNGYRINSSSSDSIAVTLTGTGAGAQQAQLVIQYSSGLPDTIHLGGFAEQTIDKLQPSVSSLFDLDTAGCDSVMRSIYFTDAGCHPGAITVLSCNIIGSDSEGYRINSISSDSIAVTLTGTGAGAQQAQLVIQYSSGLPDTIHLGGFAEQTIDKLQPSVSSLFDLDTAGCDSVMRSIYFTDAGCHLAAVTVVSCNIIGPDSEGYRINSISSDSIAVTLTGTGAGAQQAQLVIQYSSGLPDTIHLGGFAEQTVDKLQPSVYSLFDLDTAGCDSVMRSIYFTDAGCHPGAVTVLSCNIIGPDSEGYRINSISSDSIAVTLTGTGAGAQQAQLVIHYSNNLSDTIVLSGYVGGVFRSLSFSIPNVSTDTLGGTIEVPITIHGLVSAEDIDMVMHYDGSVDYLGSFSPLGAPLDVPGQQWAGRSELSITGATSGSMLGYAKFNVFNDSNQAAHATFDSVTLLMQPSTCEYSLPAPVTSTITTLSGCGIPILSQFIHLGEDPVFSIIPNPTNGNVWITSSDDVGAVTIEIYDMLGAQQSTLFAQMTKENPIELLLPTRSGVYNILVRSGEGTRTLRVVREN